jgi:hypothetical protein
MDLRGLTSEDAERVTQWMPESLVRASVADAASAPQKRSSGAMSLEKEGHARGVRSGDPAPGR